MEVISLILGNPRKTLVLIPDIRVTEKKTAHSPELFPTRATLIVVPTVLVGQWMRELRTSVNLEVLSKNQGRGFTFLDSATMMTHNSGLVKIQILTSDVLSPSAEYHKGQNIKFHYINGTPGKVVAPQPSEINRDLLYAALKFPSFHVSSNIIFSPLSFLFSTLLIFILLFSPLLLSYLLFPSLLLFASLFSSSLLFLPVLSLPCHHLISRDVSSATTGLRRTGE